MEVAQDGGQAAHVVGVGVGEGYLVQPADAARPEGVRDDFLANIEILRGLMRATAKAAAVDEQRLAVRRNEEQRVGLTYVDGFHEQGVAWVIDGAGQNGGHSGENESNPDSVALPTGRMSWRRNGHVSHHDGRGRL